MRLVSNMGPAALVLSTVDDGEAALLVPEAEPVGVAAELAAELVAELALFEDAPEAVGRDV